VSIKGPQDGKPVHHFLNSPLCSCVSITLARGFVKRAGIVDGIEAASLKASLKSVAISRNAIQEFCRANRLRKRSRLIRSRLIRSRLIRCRLIDWSRVPFG